jgi:pimeloyl-ACP methyl ester carboxylesterase
VQVRALWRGAVGRLALAALSLGGLASGGLALGCTTAPGSARVPPAPARAAAPRAIQLGQVTLRRCAAAPLAYCGRLPVPLDYSSAASPDIRIGLRWLPPTAARRPAGTVLAVEGGPGYASAGSEPAYLAMMGTLVRSRGLLLVNLRGTGNSAAVNCPGLARYGQPQHQYGPVFDRLVGACGQQLNRTWHYRHGGWVHASDLFGTADAARDVSGVLRALRLGRVDLYGDSYGSWFAQVFAARYPGQLRSVTLDSTYPVLGNGSWSATVVTARRAFTQACSRWAACAKAAGHGGAWSRIGALAARLARSPVTGQTASVAGTRTRLTVTAGTLVNLVNNAGFDPVVYRDLDAAGRALLHRHDSAPLLRLAALSTGYDNVNEPLPGFSDGLYFAVGCTDYGQLFSRSAPLPARARQYRAALRQLPPSLFAPFSVTQWTRMDQYTQTFSACLRWPAPAHLAPPIARKPPLVPAGLPVLVLSGTFDSLTPWLDGASAVTRQLGRSARAVQVANLTHVTLQDANDSCPAAIYQRFVRQPGGLARQDTACAARVAPIHTVGVYPLRLAGVVPAAAAHGNTAGRQARQAAAVALASAGDEISRWPLLDGGSDLGLRGGRITFTGGRVLRLSFRHVRWVSDATIGGTAWWNQPAGWVTARLTVHVAGSAPVRLTARWRPFGTPGQLAVITGSQGQRHLAASSPAP